MHMNVHVVNPHGYCQGVFRALKIAMEAKKSHPTSTVYLLGMIVHNEIATSALEAQGFVVLDEAKAPLEEQLKALKEGDVVVFSAHGHPKRYDEIAKSLGLIAIDATCPFVSENEASAFEAKRPLYYLGVKNHLEAEAFLANCEDSKFLNVKELNCEEKGEITSLVAQTTLSEEEVEKGYRYLSSHYEKVILLRSRCDATKIRQKAIADLPKDIDCLIVLGSERSNNSRKLMEIGKSIGIDSYLVLDETELHKVPLQSKKKVALASGASTPLEVFSKVKETLEKL